VYVHKHTTELSAADCRDLKNACTHARELREPLKTLVTFSPYLNSKPTPTARAKDPHHKSRHQVTDHRKAMGLHAEHLLVPSGAIWRQSLRHAQKRRPPKTPQHGFCCANVEAKEGDDPYGWFGVETATVGRTRLAQS